MRKILIFSLVFRLLLAPLAYHGDSFEFLNWGKNLQEFGTDGFYLRDTPDASDPNYPPGFYHMLLFNQVLYRLTRAVFWQINISIPPFPSHVFVWLDSDQGRIFFNKLPAIFSDVGLGYLIYLFVKDIKNRKAGIIASSAFLFSPPIWYNSTVWGSTESIFALPLLAAFYAVYKKKLILSSVLFTTAFLIKPIVLLALPVFLFWWLRSVKILTFVKAALISLTFFYLVHVPFHPDGTAAWILKLYRDDVLREVLGYLVANAFNFWGFIFGFEPKPDSTLLLGIPGAIWGYSIFASFTAYLLLRLKKKITPRNLLLAAALLSFAGFLFLTRVHERYFYLTLLFLAPLVGVEKKLKNAFWVLSGIHLANLYHFWWVPRIDFLVAVLSTKIVERSLILFNFAVFFWLLKTFRKEHAKT